MRKSVIVLVLMAAGCVRGTPSLPVDPGTGAPAGLAASLGARVHGDTVSLTLHVTNSGDGPVRIEFPSGQRYDFEVLTGDGTRVWQWSATRQFIAALGTERLAVDASLEYTEDWTPAKPGSYELRGQLTSSNKPVDLRTRFVVPSH